MNWFASPAGYLGLFSNLLLQDDELAARSTSSLQSVKEHCHDTATPADARRHGHPQGLSVWIAPEEVSVFSHKIVRLLGDAQVRKDLGDAGRDYAHEWSASKQAQRLLSFYQSVLDPGRLAG